MFDYIQKFNDLPKSVREKVSTSEVVREVEEMEKEYGVNLAPVIMKVMVGEVAVEELESHLAKSFGIDEEKAGKLKEQLIARVFSIATEYLGLNNSDKKTEEQKEKDTFLPSEEDVTFAPEEREINSLAKKAFYRQDFDPLFVQIERRAKKIEDEAGIIFSSTFLAERFKNIIITYLKSVRNQANTVQTLSKPVTDGGVGLNKEEADQVLRIAKREKIDLEEKPRFYPSKLRYSFDDKGELAEYPEKNLVKAEESGEEEKDKKEDVEKGEGKEREEKNNRSQEESAGRDKESQSEQEDQFEKYRQDRSYAKEAPGLDFSQLERGRDIEYDLKSVLEHKYGSSGQAEQKTELKQENKEEQEQEELKKKEGSALKQDHSSPDPDKSKKDKEKRKGFFSRIREFLFGKKSKGEQKDKQEKQVKELDKQKEQKERKEEIGNSKLEIRQEKQENREKKEERREKKRKKEAEEKKKEEKKKRKKEEKKKQDRRKEKEQKKQKQEKEVKPKEEGKKKVEDIKSAPKVMSPVDELRYMDLVKFRRLGDNAEDRALKIKKKIDLLGKESLVKKLEGIKSWRESAVNKTYLAMGQESIARGVDIKGIVQDRKKNDKDHLTEEEFNSILDLNRELRFY
jgi:hypothetical protein